MCSVTLLRAVRVRCVAISACDKVLAADVISCSDTIRACEKALAADVISYIAAISSAISALFDVAAY